MNTNVVTIEGRLTRDPEIKEAGKSQVASFGIAVNRSVRKPDGSWENAEPSFYDVQAWNKVAELVMENCTKGTPVIVIGGLRFDTWEKEGAKRSKVTINANTVGLQLVSKGNGSKSTTDNEDDIPF